MTNPSLPHGHPAISPQYQTPMRRSSYASVVSGAAGGSGNPISPSLRRSSGAFEQAIAESPNYSYLHPSPDFGADPLQSDASTTHRFLNGRKPSIWAREGWTIPGFAMSDGASAMLCSASEPALRPIPSYLRNSRYVEKLERLYRARVSRPQEKRQAPPMTHGLSRSSSSVSLQQRYNAQHPSSATRSSFTADHHPQEKAAQIPSEEGLAPLPSYWSNNDKHPALELQNGGLGVKYTGPSKTSDEAASLRADNPIPSECGFYYFEIQVLSRNKDGLIGIGLAGPRTGLTRLPGWENDSWAYHGDDGLTFACSANGKQYGPKFASGDIVGCGINFRTGGGFFTKNGTFLDYAFRDIPTDRTLYPTVGMKKPTEYVLANFGQTPFVFDIDGFVEKEKRLLRQEIDSADVSLLYKPLDERTLTKELVAQFLAHEGYVETSRAFTHAVRSEATALGTSISGWRGRSPQEDVNAARRQSIRSAILEGDIDRALKQTNAYFKHVLEENEDIHFRLRCRKFIEMIRQSDPSTRDEDDDDVADRKRRLLFDESAIEEDDDTMELDGHEASRQLKAEHSAGHNGDDGDDESMDVDDSAQSAHLLAAAIQYGQQLQAEYKGKDPKYQKVLTDTFALMAYSNTAQSMLAPLVDTKGRVAVAEELNSAILASLGSSPLSAIERMCKQTEVLMDVASEGGGPAAFFHVRNEFYR